MVKRRSSAKEPEPPPSSDWPPRFLICSCGEAFAREGPVHVCLSKAERMDKFPPIQRGSTVTGLYARWLNWKSRAETTRELYLWGRDPAFRPEPGQYHIPVAEA